MPEEKKVLEVTCEISKDSFKDDKQNKTVEYYSYLIKLGTTTVRLTPKADDKKLCNHLLDELFNEL